MITHALVRGDAERANLGRMTSTSDHRRRACAHLPLVIGHTSHTRRPRPSKAAVFFALPVDSYLSKPHSASSVPARVARVMAPA